MADEKTETTTEEVKEEVKELSPNHKGKPEEEVDTEGWESLKASDVEKLYVEPQKEEIKVEPEPEPETKKLSPTVSITPTRENEREVLISIKFHAPGLIDDDLEEIVEQALSDSADDVLLAFQEAVNQEQKYLDATRR